jgi:segregation and condensation protein A
MRVPPEIDLQELLRALRDVLSRADLFTHHHVTSETLSVRERMSSIIDRLREESYVEFANLFTVAEGRMGVVVTFLALMELLREKLVDLLQQKPFGQIYIKRPGAEAPLID